MVYRHRVRLGALVPSSASEAVSLAQRSEELGLDLVAVAEPGADDAPGELDAWTLLSWVAGRTSAIGLLAAGLELSGREPALIGRSAAALDLLSDGRVELVLAAGSPTAGRWSSAEVPAVLDEALGLVRGILEAGEAGPLRHLGAFYRVPRAERGPLPRHRIPLGVAGGEPALLRLAGRKADSVLLDLTGGEGAALRVAAEVVDEAAAGAGREAAEVRRIVVVPEGISAQALRELTAAGADTLLVRTSDPGELERFAGLRPAGGPERGVFRAAAARAKRRPGIDYDGLPDALADGAVEPGDVDYARVRSTYMRGGSPGLVLRPRDVGEVVEALAFVRRHPGVPFGLRSGGHGMSGRSTNDGGIVVSLQALDSIEVIDEERRLIRVGPGARWMDIAQRLLPHGWAISSGDYGGVGVGGLATAGGVGWMARKHGLTIDKLRAVEMVLADGRVVRASATENEELFWGVRGAGANFGAVVSFELQADIVGKVGFGQLVVAADDPADLLVRWGQAIEAAPRDLSGQLLMGPPRPGQPRIAQLMAVVDREEPEDIVGQLQPLAMLGPLYSQNVVLTPYAGVISNAAGGHHDGQGDPVSRSGLIEHLTPEFAKAAAELIDSGAIHWFQIRTVGGAVSDVSEEATAYAHRSANFSVIAMGSSKRRVDEGWARLYPHFDGLYLNFETDQRPERLADAFPPATLARLRALKERYDPDNLFRDNFALTGGVR